MTATVANPDGAGIDGPGWATAAPLWASRGTSGTAGVAVFAATSADSEGISLVLANGENCEMAQLYGHQCYCRDPAVGSAAGVWSGREFEQRSRSVHLLHSPMYP